MHCNEYSRIPIVECTVALQLHQGVSAIRAVHRLAMAFWGFFFSKKKSDDLD